MDDLITIISMSLRLIVNVKISLFTLSQSQNFNLIQHLNKIVKVVYMKKIFLMGLFCLMPILKSQAADFTDTPKLVVRGEASIFKPADQLEVVLGIVTRSETSSVALNENNQRMHQVMANLQALGLPDSDYQTGHFAIHPIYQKPPKNSNEDEHTKISQYEVINAVKVKTMKIDLAEKIITAAVQGGANQIDQLNFNLSKPQSYRDAAIQEAAQNALADANVLANTMGVQIKRVLNLSLDHWQQFPSPIMLNKRFEIAGGDVGQNVLEPGQSEIHATVNATFEIGQ